jgi:hypothetical protein
MLTVHWIKCIRDRGMTIVFDQISSVKGRIINWQLDSIKDNQIEVRFYLELKKKHQNLFSNFLRQMKNKNY